MAQFSEADINAAKRRVQEMQNRASKYTGEHIPNGENMNNRKANAHQNEEKDAPAKEAPPEAQGETDAQDKSFFIILALILLLSKEGADNTLILALLYLLL